MASYIQTIGVNDVYQYREIHLDSIRRDHGTGNNPQWIIQPSIHDVIGVKLISAHIPFSYYVINNRNNTFQIRLHSNLPNPLTVSITPGNYTTATIIDALTLGMPEDRQGFEWSLNPAKDRLILHNTAQSGFSVIFEDVTDNTDQRDIGEDTPRLYLGFGPGVTSTAGDSLVGSYPLNLTGPHYLYVNSPLVNRLNHHITTNGTSSANHAVIAKVPVTVNPGGIIEYTDPSPGYFFDLNNGQLQDLSFSLTLGHSTHEVDLNGLHWTVTLAVLTHRDTTIARSHIPDIMPGQKRMRVHH